MREQTPLRYLFLAGVLLSFAAVCLTPVKSFAQSGEGSNTANAVSSSDAAILQELERMRLRIQELEAQLKQRSPETQPTPATSQPGMTGTALVGISHAGDSSPATQPAGVSTSPDAVVVQQGSQPVSESTGTTAPFAFADWTWLNGNPRTKKPAFDSEFFTPEIRADANYVYDFNHPSDDTIGGSSEIFRAQEFQVTQFGVGGDFHYDNVQARLMTQFGMYSATTPRNDASPARGNWELDTAYRYLAEAYGGYHINALHGINLQAGIFMSYVGLFSYYNFDNWAYQPSYVSSNTPWFFNGMRVQIFPTGK